MVATARTREMGNEVLIWERGAGFFGLMSGGKAKRMREKRRGVERDKSRRYCKGLECWKFGRKLGLSSKAPYSKIARLMEMGEDGKRRLGSGESTS